MTEKKTPHFHGGRTGAAVAVHVTPRASADEIAGVAADGTIKVHLTGPETGGTANAALIDLLARVLGSPKSRIEVVAGQGGKDKLVSILDMDVETVNQRILAEVK